MNRAARWSLVFVVVVLGLIYAIWPREQGHSPSPKRAEMVTSSTPAEQNAAEASLAHIRAKAALMPCSRTSETPSELLVGVVLECLGDGAPVDIGSMLAGKPVVLNVWAYWCAPCAKELPALQDFAIRAGAAVTVLTVHNDPGMSLALQRLLDLGVHLPGLQDSKGSIAAVLGLPNVKPVTVLIREDGSVAKILPVPFTSADDIAGEVRKYLGVNI
ncbi:MAG: TlpA family protein disulfide reductase [Mycobacteriaceae bacterium]